MLLVSEARPQLLNHSVCMLLEVVWRLQMLPQLSGPLIALIDRLTIQLNHVNLKEGALSQQWPLEELMLVVQGLLCKAGAGQVPL